MPMTSMIFATDDIEALARSSINALPKKPAERRHHLKSTRVASEYASSRLQQWQLFSMQSFLDLWVHFVQLHFK
jgi:hypothetical protein